jgi:DNA-binding NarL/FixJ family response regulator
LEIGGGLEELDGKLDGKIRVLVADQQPLFRDAVRVALTSQSDFAVVAEARDGVQAVAEAERTRPDVALLDAGLPNCDGIRATRLIRERAPGCRILVLSADDDEQVLVDALDAGANGYLTKTSSLPELIEAVRVVHRGEMPLPPRILEHLLTGLIRRHKEQDELLRRLARLTRREREVLTLLSEGADNGAIAQALVISPQTARTHIQHVLHKLGVHSRLEAAALARQRVILDQLATAN